MGNIEAIHKGHLYGLIDTDKTVKYELTVSYIEMNEDYVRVICEPYLEWMRLYKNNPDFVNLYNKLKSGLTYKFIISEKRELLCSINEIIDIIPCSEYKIKTKVLGFLNLDNENLLLIRTLNHDFKNYEQIFIGIDNKRLMINKEYTKDIVIGKEYNFTYEKAFGDKFYLVTEYELSK